MTAQTIDTEALKARFDLRDLAGQRVELHKHTKTELCGPCPKCGGRDRFFVARDYFGCRQCRTGGDVIAYMQWLENVSFVEAVQMLDATAIPTPAQPAPRPMHPTPAHNDWNQAQADAHLAECQAVLPDSAGADYLTRRGLSADTWDAYGLGYDTKQDAIAMPWYRGGRLSGIRYRLLAPSSPKRKVISEPGSSFRDLLFGAQALVSGLAEYLPNGFDPLSRRSLILVEGEINAMSLWQELYPAAVDVLSFGAQDTPIPASFLPIASRYRAVIVWKDEEHKARAEAAKLPGAGAYWSTVDEVKRDANDLLRDRLLVPLVSKLLVSVTPEDGQEGLHWDLWDLQNL